MKVIGIDIGTTTISLVVLDTEKKAVLESRTVPNGTFIRTEKEWERIQNPDRIVENGAGRACRTCTGGYHLLYR